MKRIETSKNELRELYKKKGLTTYEIADIYNCCQATVWKRLREFNIKPRSSWNAVSLSKDKLRYLYVKEKLSTWEIEKQYGYPRSTVYRKLIEYGIRPRTRAQAHIIYPRKDFSGNKIEQAYLIGFATGDLRARKFYPEGKTICIDCGSTKKEQIDLISDLFSPYGRVWISKPNKKGAVQIQCNLNLSFNFLLKKRSLIDTWILKNKKYFAAFLAGFTDADGSIFISQGKANYSLGNYNQEILGQIREKLIELKIDCPRIREGKNKGYVSKDGYVQRENYFHLSINRKFYLFRLFSLIGPYLKHAQKLKDIKRAKNNIRLRNKKYGNINMNLCLKSFTLQQR